MNTFLQFNQTLLGFVNYKLYSDLELLYPPSIDQKLLEDGAFLGSFQIENINGEAFAVEPFKGKKQVSKKLQAQVDQSLANIKVEEDSNEVIEDEIMDVADDDEFSANVKVSGTGQLFAGHVFWISREVPLYLTQFIILSCGGKLGWELQAGGGSPYTVDDSRITIQITDRPLPSELHKREYLQPQWLYDCINQNKLVKTTGYHPGESLPPHLSPFVSVGENDYSPSEEITVICS
jgi:pescadillo protein